MLDVPEDRNRKNPFGSAMVLLLKQKIKLPSDVVILLLGICLQIVRVCIQLNQPQC